MNALIRCSLLAIVSFSPLLTSFAWAQLPAKVPVCRDSQGREVPVIVDVRVPTYAAAFYHPDYRRPMIVMNPKIADHFTTKFNAWVYLHECGHVTLGHVEPSIEWSFASLLRARRVDRVAQVKELEADCWGMRQAVKHGYIKNEMDVKEVLEQMIEWKEDPEHPSGVVRSKGILQCLKIR